MKTLKSISSGIRFGDKPVSLILPVVLCLSGILASAQGYYDDDLYYDASKAKKETPQAPPANAGQATAGPRYIQTPAQAPASGMYYYDGAAYVPWDSVGDFRSADSYIPAGGSTRDVDEYNRRGSFAPSATPDSVPFQDFEEMPATSNLARFSDSQVAKDAIAAQGMVYGDGTSYADIYNAGYSTGYDDGYNASPNTALSINFGVGYPYGYYDYYNPWGWPYYSWRDPYYWYSPAWTWGWDYPWSWRWGWGWNWGWTSPAWAWGHPGYYPGSWGIRHYHPSPSAAHRPRPAGNSGGRYGHATPGSSVRPGYRPPASANGGYYGGSSSGRNSHFGTSQTGYRPTGGTGYGSGNSGATRPAGTANSSSSRGNFGASQSTRNGSYNSGSSRSGSYNSGRSSGSYSGGGRSGGHSSGGGRSGGGGHRSR